MLLSHTAAVFTRCHVHIFAKGPVVITDVVKTGLPGNRADGKICLTQQARAFADAEIVEVVKGGHIRHFLEKTA